MRNYYGQFPAKEMETHGVFIAVKVRGPAHCPENHFLQEVILSELQHSAVSNLMA